MPQSIIVRQAVESDAEHPLHLRTTVFAETEFMLWTPEEFMESVADEARRIGRLNGQSNSRYLVAEVGHELVGFLNAVGGHVNRLRHSATLAMAVGRSYWGKGIGSPLVHSALSWSREARLRCVELTVHTCNERALNLYKRLDFEVEGLRRSSLLVNGSYRDEYVLSILNEV